MLNVKALSAKPLFVCFSDSDRDRVKKDRTALRAIQLCDYFLTEDCVLRLAES